MASFPKIHQAHSPTTIKPKLSVVSRLAYQWPLQNLSIPISVMNKVAKLTPCCPCIHVLCVCLTRSLKCRPTSLLVPLPKYLTSYIYKNCPAPLLCARTAVVVLRVILQQQQQQQRQRQHLLSTVEMQILGAHS